MTKIPYGYQEPPPISAGKYKAPKERLAKAEDEPSAEIREPVRVIGNGKPKSPSKLKHRPREQYVEEAREAGLEKVRGRVRRVFSKGPMTVAQIMKKERLTARSNTRTMVAKWAKLGLIEIVGTKGTHPGVQNLWDIKKELKK